MAFVYLLFAIIPMFFALRAHAQNTETIYLSAEENQFYQMINQFRSDLHLPTLQIHVFLQRAARKHSDWMASNDQLTHYGPLAGEPPFQRMAEEGYVNYVIAGENVSCGNGDAVKTFKQFAFSPEHLENMMNPHFRHFGVARAGTGNESNDGRLPSVWWSMHRVP